MSALHKDIQVLCADHIDRVKKPLLVVLGATASGKTKYSIDLALRLGNIEIINADSRQLYKYMDIGTAKITDKEKSGIPHHLLDIIYPNEESTIGIYKSQCVKTIKDILKRGKIPILVGGSMLYLSSIIDNLTLAPSTPTKLRNRYIREYEADEGFSLYARLCEIDPKAAKSIHRHNMPHLIRALEIYELTKKPKSFVFSNMELRSNNSVNQFDIFIIGMRMEQNMLYERINKRTEFMMRNGWIEEVSNLISLGYLKNDPGMKSHGYRELVEYIENGRNQTIEKVINAIAAKSRQYAKRQITWWRGDKRINWIKT